MTRRRQVEHRIRSVEQIREIMGSMKTLAFMETRKIAGQLANQQQALHTIELAAHDFISLHPGAVPEVEGLAPAYVLVGTQRGFCGDFNQRVVQCLEAHAHDDGDAEPAVIAVGDRLCTSIAGDRRLTRAIAGADVAEQVQGVLCAIVAAVRELREQRGPLSLAAVFQRHGRAEVSVVPLLPPFRRLADAGNGPAVAPLLNLSPQQFFLGLVDNFLLAALHAALNDSLMAENHARVQHLDGAVRHLDDRLAALRRRGNQLRQEEIIEEIEVMLLGAADPQALAPGSTPRDAHRDHGHTR